MLDAPPPKWQVNVLYLGDSLLKWLLGGLTSQISCAASNYSNYVGCSTISLNNNSMQLPSELNIEYTHTQNCKLVHTLGS